MNSSHMFLIATIFVAVIGIMNMPNASAYVHHDCHFGSDIVTIKSLGNLTSTYDDELELALANYNNIGTDVFFDKATSGTVNIEVFEYDSVDGNNAITTVAATCDDGTEITHPANHQVTIKINDNYVSAYSDERRIAIWSHELGHALALDHHSGTSTNEQATNMYTTATSHGTFGIFYPVLDDIRGINAKYGSPVSTSQCNTSTQSGTITYTGGACSAGNPRLPMMETVTTAGSGNRAFAYDATTSLPAVGTILVNAIVDPQTTYRFSLGVHTNTNVADGGSRYGTIEITNGEIQAAWSFLGFTQTSTMDTVDPSTAKDYWIQLVMQNGDIASAHAYENNGSATTEPTYLGFATFTPSGSWSGTKYTGTGVWTDNGGNPASDYDIESYNNRQKSYT